MSQFSAPISPEVPVNFHPRSGKCEDYILVKGGDPSLQNKTPMHFIFKMNGVWPSLVIWKEIKIIHGLNSTWAPGKKDIIVYWETQVTAW